MSEVYQNKDGRYIRYWLGTMKIMSVYVNDRFNCDGKKRMRNVAVQVGGFDPAPNRDIPAYYTTSVPKVLDLVAVSLGLDYKPLVELLNEKGWGEEVPPQYIEDQLTLGI